MGSFLRVHGLAVRHIRKAQFTFVKTLSATISDRPQ